MLNKMKGYSMDNFDKWFLIIMGVVVVILLILWAVSVGVALDNLIKELM